MKDEFYIGWEDRAPLAYAQATRRFVIVALAVTALVGIGFAAAQGLIGTAVFEWGNVQEFTGVLHADPYPHLVLRDETTNGATRVLAAPLVATFKFGVKREEVAALDGRPVRLRGTKIHRDGKWMIELQPRTVAGLEIPSGQKEQWHWADEAPVALGEQTFRGEIVDSKCWMGVMNPGVLTPHRACAVRCISGGIPPMLLVRREGEPPLNLLLVSPEGKPVNDAVLALVAEPVEITGDLERRNDLLILRADPGRIRRLR